MKKICLLSAMVGLFAVACFGQAQYVNPMVGTDGHGHTYPGAIVPFGGVQVSPDTRLDGWDGCSAYHYSDDVVYGFSHTHLSGTGCSDYGDILLMPFTGKPSLKNTEYCSKFSHRNEVAQAGYYAVVLDKNKVKVELTATKHVGFQRYTFPDTKGPKGVVIDLTHRDKVISSGMNFQDNEIQGWRESEAWNPHQYCAFSLVASQPIQRIDFYQDDKLVDAQQVRGTNCKAVVYFQDNVRQVVLKVAISGTDMQGAHTNQSEIKDFDFNAIHANATALWNKELGKIEVSDPNPENLKVFYTALYHSFTSPYLFSDMDGRYRGMDGQIHVVDKGHQMYTVFSLWDTYRALHPLLNIIDRQRTNDFLYTFLKHYEQGTMLPVWELSAYETWCMIGYHSVPVIYDAYVKGMHDYDANEMLAAMVHSATLNKLGRPQYAQYGYIPGDMENESVSKTLEYAYDDWCIAQFAKQIGNDKVYREFIDRAQYYKNIMDVKGFMHGKINGGFVTPFNPTEVNNFFTEANSWQYSTYVPQDIDGFVDMLGGKKVAIAFLDSLFSTSSNMSGRQQADITGTIGQYAHGNEPSHHAIYLYDYLGLPYKTQALARKIMTELYTSKPDGLCGNEDCGQMSGWYVISSMGFYEVCPGSNQYAIGYPMFSKVVLHLENGKTLTITKDSNKPYIQSVKWNGKDYPNAYITYQQIVDGGELAFTMGDKPSAWGTGVGQQPESGIKPTITVVPYFSIAEKRFNNQEDVSILLYQPLAGATPEMQSVLSQTKIYYTVDGSEPTPQNGILYVKPIHIMQDVVLKAIAYNAVTGASKVVEAKYTRYVKDKNITYITKPQPQYFYGGEDGLIDNLRGTENYRVGGWQGFNGDFEAVVDLLNARQVNAVGVGCLSEVKSWIFFPSKVIVEISDDNVHFKPYGEFVCPTPVKQDTAFVQDMIVKGNAQGRYIKIKVVNYGKLPSWHISAGEQAWLFVDEVWVK